MTTILVVEDTRDLSQMIVRELRMAGFQVILAEAYIALLNGQPLTLTHLEFDLLVMLARSTGHTFSRAYLFKTVWKQAYLEGDCSVDKWRMSWNFAWKTWANVTGPISGG